MLYCKNVDTVNLEAGDVVVWDATNNVRRANSSDTDSIRDKVAGVVVSKTPKAPNDTVVVANAGDYLVKVDGAVAIGDTVGVTITATETNPSPMAGGVVSSTYSMGRPIARAIASKGTGLGTVMCTIRNTFPHAPGGGGGPHASTHQHLGNDEVATATSGANAIPKAGGAGTLAIGWIPTGTSSATVCIGNDSRLSDARTPLGHSSSHQNGGADELNVGGLSGLLADPQTPLAHTHPESDVTNLVTDLGAKENTSSKGAASGYAGLDASSLVVQNPVNAVTASAANKIVKADAAGKIDTAWIKTGATNGLDADMVDGIHASSFEQTANKGVANGYASLNASSLVLQNPLNAETASTPNKLVQALATGKIDPAWVTEQIGIVDLSDVTAKSGTGTIVLMQGSPTLSTPYISDYTNAGHNHTTAALGGQLTDAALSSAIGIAKGGTGQTGQVAAFDALAPGTTKGDLIVHNGTDNIRLGSGSNGQVLAVASTAASGLQWTTSGGGTTDKDDQYYRQTGSTLDRFYIAGMGNSTALVTAASPSANVLRALPFYSTRGGTLDSIGIATTVTASGASRIGIYQATSDTNLVPNNLILDCGTVSHTTPTGAKTLSINVSLTANTLYWVAIVHSGSAGTIRALAVGGCGAVFGLDSAFGTAPGIGFSGSFAYAPLPATFPAGAILAAVPIPAIGVRFSA